ncbi:MAG: hypothetical protein V3W28_08155 [Thermoplasmata archaeon]
MQEEVGEQDPQSQEGGRVFQEVQSDERSGAESHQHVDSRADQRKWLESRPDEAATMRLHAYCLTCGRVKTMARPTAKRLGFYLTGLTSLKACLERRSDYAKMTQSQSRLVTKALEGLKDFEDPYGMSLEVQARLYFQAVHGVRPDLDEELVLRLLPTTRRRSRRPIFDLQNGTSAG